MFLRKLTVMALPLALLGASCVVLPWMSHWGFWSPVAQGALLGVVLALLLPLCGAVRKREPFAGLLIVPALLCIGLIICQYLISLGHVLPVLGLLFCGDWTVITAEGAFAAFMLVTCLRTKR